MMLLITTIKIIIIIQLITIILRTECVYNDANSPIVMIRAHYLNKSLIVLSLSKQLIGWLRFPPRPCPCAPSFICIKSMSSKQAMQLPQPRSPGDSPATDDVTPHLTH